MSYSKGLHEISDGVWAYLQPDGSWGWSNAGLVTDGDAALLVDTLFDLPLTVEMLEAMRRAVPAAERIGIVVNTHANGDHCYGNQLVEGAEIIATTAAADEMREVPAERLAALVDGAESLGEELAAWVRHAFGPFDFRGITMTLPTHTFSGDLELQVGDRRLRLVDMGPAHTRGDLVVVLPEAGVVFTGDLLFHGGHPVVWAGPVGNWIAACERLLALDGVETVVPGHGAVTGKQAIRDFKAYFEHLTAEARARFDAGIAPIDAAVDILHNSMGDYADWGDAERLAVNVTTLYRDFGEDTPSDLGTSLAGMARLHAETHRSQSAPR